MYRNFIVWVITIFFPCALFCQGLSCSSATQICSGQPFNYAGLTGQPNTAAISCCSTTPNRGWFYFYVGIAGDIHITISSNPARDIDFVCWGPFDSVDLGCTSGLTNSNKIDCSYAGGTALEVVDLPTTVQGKYYIIMVTNFSNLACGITINQTSGTGNMSCLIPPVISSNSPLCSGQNLQLFSTAVAGATYQWTGPNGFTSNVQNPVIPNATTSSAGNYSLVLTNGNASTAPVTLNVIVNQSPQTSTIGNTSVCAGTELYIGGVIQPGITYNWSSAPSGFSSNLANPSVIPTQTTTYTETVTATNGCSGSSSVTINVNPMPVASAGTITSVCSGNSIQLGAPPIAGNTYLWSSIPAGFYSNQANPVVFPFATTLYILTVTSSAMCVAIDSADIDVQPGPSAYTGPSQNLCIGNQVTIGAQSAQGFNYVWTSVPAGFTSSISNPIVSPVVNTTYTLVETNLVNGCVATNSLTITAVPYPAAVAGYNSAVCKNTSASIGAPSVAGNTYSWTSNPAGFTSTVSDPVVTPMVTTTYTLTETITSTGCTKSNSVTVIVNPLPLANTGPDQSICAGNSTTIGGPSVQGSVYSWVSVPAGFTSSASNPIVYPSVTTTYKLTETISATACTKTKPMLVTVEPNPTVSLSNFPIICRDAAPLFLTGGHPLGGTYSGPGISAGFFNPGSIAAGTYSITYQYLNSSGCIGSASQFITTIVKPKILGHITYDNTLNSNIDSCKVCLKNTAGQLIDSVWNEIDGTYTFRCVNSGNYTNSFSSIKKWGGVNATDALLTAQFSIGLTNLSPFRQLAGDVNLSGYLNAADAYMIVRRYIHVVNSFPCGDWIKEPFINVVVASQSVSCGFITLCAGDVNGSYIPPLNGQKPYSNNEFTPILVSSGTSEINPDKSLLLPVYTERELNLSAMSMVMAFDTTELEISGIISKLEGLQYSIIGDKIRIGWFDVNARSFRPGGMLFKISARLKQTAVMPFPLQFSIDSETEFADDDANAIADVRLYMPLDIQNNFSKIQSDETIKTNLIQLVTPNPTTGFSQVSLYCPAKGECEASIYDQLGKLVSHNSFFANNTSSINFAVDLSSCMPGLYYLVVRFDGKNKSVTERRKLFLAN